MQLSIPHSSSQKEMLLHLVDIFYEKNKHINLSAIRDKEGIIEKHIYDSLAAFEYITQLNPKTILDMGSGGGFPTLPLAIMFPNIQFYPVDSVAKKLKCIEEFASTLGLSNVHVLNGRAEDLAHKKEHRNTYDMVVTRAFAHFSPMLEMTLPFVHEKKYLLAYKGPEYDKYTDEMLVDHFGGFVEDVLLYTLAGGEKREIWKIKKVEPTAKKYPRKVGVPKKDPVEVL